MRQCADCGQLIQESKDSTQVCPSCHSTSFDNFYGYLPQRISGGSLQEEGLEVILRDRKELLPWGKIRMIFLGIIHDPLLRLPTTAYGPITKRMEEKARKDQKIEPREKVYIEIFVSDQEKPFRMDAAHINYRSFLPEINHITGNNLRKLLDSLSEKLPNCKFDQSFRAYQLNQKDSARHYASVYEFQRDCLEKWEMERKKTT